MNWMTVLIVSSLVSSALCLDSCIVKLRGSVDYNQDDISDLTCRFETIGNPVDKIEIRETHGLIYYGNSAHNTSNFKVCVDKTTDEPDHEVYLYTVRAKLNTTFDGKTFTCQCGASTSSLTISVTDSIYGDCSGTSTNALIAFEDGTVFTDTRGPPTYMQPCGVSENITVKHDNCDDGFAYWTLEFWKPAACTRRLALWGWNKQTNRTCELDIAADVIGYVISDVHTFNVSQTNVPKCIDGSSARVWDYVLKLKSGGGWLDQARVFDPCPRGESSNLAIKLNSGKNRSRSRRRPAPTDPNAANSAPTSLQTPRYAVTLMVNFSIVGTLAWTVMSLG